jgi:peptidoglycan/LPS O-acetylase OafA/YrhL
MPARTGMTATENLQAVGVESERPERSSSRLLAIDVLRAFAVISVLFAHIIPADSTPAAIKAALAVVKGGGWIGVDLFFALSGFLVSSLLFKEYERYGAIRPGRFLIRRGLKIYPAFYAMLAVTLLYGLRGWQPVTGRSFLAEALFVQNYFPHVWGHTWTLAVEEHFYLILTAGLFFLSVRGRRKNLSGKLAFRPLVPAYFLVAGFCLAARILTYLSAAGRGEHPIYIATHLRVDELFFGVLLSYLWAFEGEKLRATVRRHRTSLTVGVAIVPPTFFLSWPDAATGTVGFLLLQLSFGTLLLLMLLRQINPSRATTFLSRTGVASYSIYLWHLPWRDAVDHITGWIHVPASAWPIPLIMYLVGSVAVGIGAAALIELPVLRIRDRLVPSRSGRPAFAAATPVSTADGAAVLSPLLTPDQL